MSGNTSATSKAKLLNATFANTIPSPDQLVIFLMFFLMFAPSAFFARRMKSLTSCLLLTPPNMMTCQLECSRRLPQVSALWSQNCSTYQYYKNCLMEWKIALVSPIPKGGNHSDPKNYRPTSLLSILLEKHIRYLLVKHFEKEHPISAQQWGFTHGKSIQLVPCCLPLTNGLDFSSRDMIPIRCVL